MSVEDRIRQLADEIVACQDDGKTAVLAEELQDAIRERVIHLRAKLGAIPLGRYDRPYN
jgi:signal transduction histidine kinase